MAEIDKWAPSLSFQRNVAELAAACVLCGRVALACELQASLIEFQAYAATLRVQLPECTLPKYKEENVLYARTTALDSEETFDESWRSPTLGLLTAAVAE